MKKAILLSAACWLTAISASAIDWNVVPNIAKGCATKASTSRSDMPASAAADGDLGTSWQAVIVGDEGTPATRSNDWLLIDLGAEKQVADIEIVQQVARATRYDMYVSAAEPTIVEGDFEGELKIDEAWLNANTPVYSHNESAEPESAVERNGAYNDTHHLATPVTGRYLLMYTREYEWQWAPKYGTRVFEVLVGEYTAGYNTVKSIGIENLTLSAGATTQCVVSAYTAGGNKAETLAGVENLSLTLSDPDAAEITGGENGVYTIRAQKMGMYTLTATATINGETVTATATLNIQFSWDTVQNAALNKNAYASHNSGEAGLSVDGNMGTRWGVGGDIRNNTWYYVDLGGLYTISAIAPTWETAYASHYKYYTATELGADNAPLWVELAEINKTIDGANMYTDTYVLPAPVEARYVKLKCLQSEVWGMSFYEFRVAGEAAGKLEATEIALSAERMVLMTGESVQISALVKDNYNNQMDVTPALRIVEGEGVLDGNRFTATAKGKVVIEATCEKLTATLELNVAADASEKINLAGATATADDKTNAENPASNAIDGNPGTLWITAQGEGAEAAEHWLQVDLDYVYDLDAITISWEGASPADYKVFAGSDENNLTEVYSVTGMPGMRNYTDVIAAGVKGARVIRVVTTKNATGYGIKIFELEAYGTLAAGQGYTRTVTADEFGTLCLPFDAEVSGAELYTVEGILNGNSIVLTPAESVKGGQAYVFRATAGELTADYEAGSVSGTVVGNNGLLGTLKGINAGKDENSVELTGRYVLVNNTWKFCGNGCSLAANRAYLTLGEVPVLESAAPNSILLAIFNDNQTGIQSAVAADADATVNVYTLDGVRVRRDVPVAGATAGLAKGIYVVDGKKVVVK